MVFFATLLLSLVLSDLTPYEVQAGTVQINKDQLWVDGESQPQLFGAELQYFRLRGGSGPNIPRNQVIALWNQALDRMVEAKMNAISFYIPWDFHEYAEGKFDFTGTADDDADGHADYPSRDIFTFFRLIQEHGIKHIMVRPGPYINAEWGFLGFGAVPLWFHEKYPNSHARNSKGQRTTLYSYNDPDFLRHSKIWIETLYREVIHNYVGLGRPISFIQIDNETNLMWQSIYNHDYGSQNVYQYQKFLKKKYNSLSKLNSQHGHQWHSWEEIKPPTQPGQKITEDQDWYRYQDYSLNVYLKKIRKIWKDLGLSEPKVLFTLAESYNATENGLLPNYRWRNSRDSGMMTVNLYPKTYESTEQSILNQPFKADHDVKTADAASDFYLGHREEWVLGPEIQGGWWKGIDVSEKSRLQTYLTTIGHGLKAIFIYYFNEGNNWQHDWMKKAITPYFDKLKSDGNYKVIDDKNLPDSFWSELDNIVADKFLVVNTRHIWLKEGPQPETLEFDAPLGPDAQPRQPYRLLKDIGLKLVAPYGDFLAKARALEDPVCIIKDSAAHAPSAVFGVNSRIVQSDWNAGLLGLLMHAGVNARIHHWKLNSRSDLLDNNKCRLVIYQDTGFATRELIDTLARVIDQGGAVLSFIHTGLTDAIKAIRPHSKCSPLPTTPIDAIGQSCKIGSGRLYHAKVPLYDVFNTDFYHLIHDARERLTFINRILEENKIIPQVKIKGGGDRTVTFARANGSKSEIWITAKTSKLDGFKGQIQWTDANPSESYFVTNVLDEITIEISGNQLATEGFQFELAGSGSAAFYLKQNPHVLSTNSTVASFDQWLKLQEQISITQMLQNISPEGAAPGVVIASPSRQSPDYRYHWIRDASLVIDVVVNRYAKDVSHEIINFNLIRDFILLSRNQQIEPSAEGLGEPRFLPNGKVDTIKWARPQFDGPALRALTLIHFLNLFSKNSLSKENEELKSIALDVIRTDIDFVINNWRKPCFDLWEELRGQHFYTQAIQASAMAAAAEFFNKNGNAPLASRLDQEVLKVEHELDKYWDHKKRYIVASLNREDHPQIADYKDENLDTSVILAAIHSHMNRRILSFTDDRLLATAYALERAFAKEYAINHSETALAIGRFTDDVYFGGNPWYVTTAAFAELYYRVAQAITKNGEIRVTKNNIGFFQSALDKSQTYKLKPGIKISNFSFLGRRLINNLNRKGDTFLSVIRKYASDQGKMSEQFDRDAGVPVSAYDLTWSYASFLSAIRVRE